MQPDRTERRPAAGSGVPDDAYGDAWILTDPADDTEYLDLDATGLLDAGEQ